MQIRQCKFIIYFENVKKLFYIFELFQKPNMIKYNKKYEDKKISMFIRIQRQKKSMKNRHTQYAFSILIIVICKNENKIYY